MQPPDSTSDGAPGLHLIPGQRVFLDVRSAAAYVHRSVATMNRLRGTGQGPRYIQHARGGRVEYALDDLNAWVDAHRRQSTSDRGAA